MSQDWETPRRARSRLRAAAVGLAVVITVGMLVRPADPSAGTDGALEVAHATPTPTPSPTRTPRISRATDPTETPTEDEEPTGELAGTWQRVADRPELPPDEATVVHDGGDSVYIVGGLSWDSNDGSTRFHEGAWRYDAGEDAWIALPPSPLGTRAAVSAAWTGTELVVWGGRDRTALHADGAAFDPAGGTWRMIADAPLSPRQGAIAAWTGDGVLVTGGHDFAGGLTDGAIWDPQTDTWTGVRDLPSAPVSWGPWGRAAPAVRVGDHVLLAHTGPAVDHAGASLVTPLWLVDDGWVATELPDHLRRDWMLALAARSTGDVVGLVVSANNQTRVDLVVLPRGSDRWERLGEAPLRGMDLYRGALVADRYLVVVADGGMAADGGVAYDLLADEWLQLPDGPATGDAMPMPQLTVVALPDGFLVLPSGARFVLADDAARSAADGVST